MRTFPLPPEFKQKIPKGNVFFTLTETLKEKKLHTVCEEAKCPNRTDCYHRGTLAFQILGDICTRKCAFCGEKSGKPNTAVDPGEAKRILEAVQKLKLNHVVITSPARDDLKDGGSSVFSDTVSLLKNNLKNVSVEVLISDFKSNINSLKTVLDSQPDILNHNIETVKRLTSQVRSKATYEISLKVLKFSSEYSGKQKVKSGMMVGLGETMPEIFETITDLFNAGVRFLTIGQYLQPSFDHISVKKFYSMNEFKEMKIFSEKMGFKQVFCDPLVRSSYHADEMLSVK